MKNSEFTIIIIGGYGTFGSKIARSLAAEPGVLLVIAGRNAKRASRLADTLDVLCPHNEVHPCQLDINHATFPAALAKLQPDLVIHTCGPFQGQDYAVAQACIACGAHYLDLADGREFVTGITQLNQQAKVKHVLLVSGASSVPGLSSAVIDEFFPQFSQLDSVHHSIAPGQFVIPGLATVRAILSYVGRPFFSLKNGKWQLIFGWQDIHREDYGVDVGKRWLATCDVPDLELFPTRYPSIKTVEFHAGVELPCVHLSLWAMSWLARLRLVNNWSRYAKALTKLGRFFTIFGSDRGAMKVKLRGKSLYGENLEFEWTLVAKSGHGPRVPTIASIILAKKLLHGTCKSTGAMPCVGLFTLQEFMDEVAQLDIEQQVARREF